jgi:hypothetical protein
MSQKHLLDVDLEHYSVTARTVLNLQPPAKRLGELTFYTAAAGSALALAPVAEASIIYSGVKNIQVLNHMTADSSKVVDLNGDGQDDMRFFAPYPFTNNGGTGPRVIAGMSMLGGGVVLAGSAGGILRLDASAADLNGKGNYNPPLNTLGGTVWANKGTLLKSQNGLGNESGFWKHTHTYGTHGTAEGFAGIKLANDDFGWLRFELSTSLFPADHPDLTSLTLVDWAYQSVPGASIHVGDPDSIPEPSSLGLMALGAAGIAMLRRRRSSRLIK